MIAKGGVGTLTATSRRLGTGVSDAVAFHIMSAAPDVCPVVAPRPEQQPTLVADVVSLHREYRRGASPGALSSRRSAGA